MWCDCGKWLKRKRARMRQSHLIILLSDWETKADCSSSNPLSTMSVSHISLKNTSKYHILHRRRCNNLLFHSMSRYWVKTVWWPIGSSLFCNCFILCWSSTLFNYRMYLKAYTTPEQPTTPGNALYIFSKSPVSTSALKRNLFLWQHSCETWKLCVWKTCICYNAFIMTLCQNISSNLFLFNSFLHNHWMWRIIWEWIIWQIWKCDFLFSCQQSNEIHVFQTFQQIVFYSNKARLAVSSLFHSSHCTKNNPISLCCFTFRSLFS